MKLSTMTNLYYKNTPDQMGLINSIRKTAAAGFKTMDLCLCPMQRGEMELCADNWEELAYAIGNEAAKLGVELSQSHLSYPKPNSRRKTPFDPGCEQNDYFSKMLERTVQISCMLGIKWAVAHPVQQTDGFECDRAADIEYNHFIYGKHVETATKHGVGIAFENMADVEGKRRFGVTADELCALVDSFEGAKVGVCWDFGHSNRVLMNQEPQLRRLKGYLTATHVDDNVGKDDLHTVPFLGNIPWERVMPVLAEIGYEGDFNFELSTMKRLPDELKDYAAKFIYETGKYLLTLAK